MRKTIKKSIGEIQPIVYDFYHVAQQNKTLQKKMNME